MNDSDEEPTTSSQGNNSMNSNIGHQGQGIGHQGQGSESGQGQSQSSLTNHNLSQANCVRQNPGQSRLFNISAGHSNSLNNSSNDVNHSSPKVRDVSLTSHLQLSENNCVGNSINNNGKKSHVQFQSTPLTYHLDRPHGQLSSSAQPDMNFGQTNHPASYTIKANNTPRTGQQPSLSLGYMKSVVRDLENHGPLCSDSGLADSGQPNFSESQTGITGHNLGQTSLSSYSLDEASQVSPPLSFSSKSSYNLGETNRLFRYNFGRPSQSSHNIGQVGHNIGQLRHNIGPCGSEGHARQPSNAAQSVIAPYELFGQRNCGPIMGEAGLNQVNAGPTSAAFLRSEVAPPTFLSDLDGERSYTAANAQG
ncbi:hypothetical protein DPMN_107974, partial [Dreissena polymorpha]